MRTGDYFLFALKDLRRQFTRSLLTVIALTISTAILVTMAAISIGGRQVVIDQFGSDDSLSTIAVAPNQGNGTLSPFGSVQEVKPASSKLNDTTVEQLLGIQHVTSASPRAHVWEFHHFSIEGSDKQFVAQAEGIPFDAQLALQAGDRFASNHDEHVVILGSAYAKEISAGDPGRLIGKTITITTQKGYRGQGAAIPAVNAPQQTVDAFNQAETIIQAKVIGITQQGVDQNSIFVPLDWARAIRTVRYNEASGVKSIDQLANDGYSTIQARVDNVSHVKQVSGAIENLGYGQLSTLDQVERLQQFTTILWIVLGSVALIAIIAAALGVVNTMLMAVSEQRYTIGVWRAVGARRRTIMCLFLTQAGIIGAIGGSIGVAIGWGASYYVNLYGNSLLAAQGLSLANIAEVPFWLAIGAVALTTMFGLLAGLYPANRAARLDPSTALTSGQ
jgi:putative ABC transport system permease protein